MLLLLLCLRQTHNCFPSDLFSFFWWNFSMLKIQQLLRQKRVRFLHKKLWFPRDPIALEKVRSVELYFNFIFGVYFCCPYARWSVWVPARRRTALAAASSSRPPLCWPGLKVKRNCVRKLIGLKCVLSLEQSASLKPKWIRNQTVKSGHGSLLAGVRGVARERKRTRVRVPSKNKNFLCRMTPLLTLMPVRGASSSSIAESQEFEFPTRNFLSLRSSLPKTKKFFLFLKSDVWRYLDKPDPQRPNRRDAFCGKSCWRWRLRRQTRVSRFLVALKYFLFFRYVKLFEALQILIHTISAKNLKN